MIERPSQLGISGASTLRPPVDPERGPDRSRPRLALLAAAVGGAALGAAASLPLSVATGLEPLPAFLPFAAATGLVVAIAVERRRPGDAPSLAQILQHLAALVAISAAIVVLVEIPYLFWLRKTVTRFGEAEWKVLAGMSQAESRAILGEPDRRVPEPEGERWIYARRFGRLERFRAELVFEKGRFRRSEIEGVSGMKLIWSRPPLARKSPG